MFPAVIVPPPDVYASNATSVPGTAYAVAVTPVALRLPVFVTVSVSVNHSPAVTDGGDADAAPSSAAPALNVTVGDVTGPVVTGNPDPASVPVAVVVRIMVPAVVPSSVHVNRMDAPPASGTGIEGNGPSTSTAPPVPLAAGTDGATEVAPIVPVFVTVSMTRNGTPGHSVAADVVSAPTRFAGAVSTKPVPLVAITVVVHAPDPATYAVFVTAVVTETEPTTPVTVKVQIWPSPIPAPTVPLHRNRVPDATDVTVAAGNVAGWSPVAPVTTGEIVSVTTRFVIVIVPEFTITIRYVTGLPVPGAAGVCSSDTVNPVTGAGSTAPTGFVVIVVVEHRLVAITKPVFDTARSAQTTP